MMSKHIHILGISGSLRHASHNRKLLVTAQGLLPQDVTMEIADLHNLPMFNTDLEADGLPEPVLRFREQLQAADAFIFASPEYNYSISGAMKNAIDWASRRGPDELPPINDKPAALLSGGGRFGALRSQLHLREILSHNNLYVLNRSVQIPYIGRAFDENGRLLDDTLRDRIANLVQELADWTRQFRAV